MEFKGLEKKTKRGIITYWKEGEMVYKQCGKCGEIKLVDEFYKTRGNSRTNKCKMCEKQYYQDNIEYKRECAKQRYKDNAEYIKEYQKQYYRNNAEYKKEYYRQWAENNTEYRKEYMKQYNSANKEYMKEYCKQWRKDAKENNLQEISDIVEQINPIFKQLDLPVYGYIYKFENIKTGHVYIGQTTRLLNMRYNRKDGVIKSWIEERFKKENQKFTDELIEEDFIATELFDVAFCKWHLNALEVYWINCYDSHNNGYNNTAGNHITDDGIEEFNQILSDHNLEFKDGKLIQIKSTHQDR